MRNITFRADAQTIELAREEARRRKTTLNHLVREWLEDLAARNERRRKIDDIQGQMNHSDPGGSETREEMNRR